MSKKVTQKYLQVIISFALLLTSFSSAKDWRDFSSGYEIPDEDYCDQPYIVKTKDGNWLCTLTTGRASEGQRGQHVVATISTDKGCTWSPLIDIEPADGPEASWVVPLLTPGGRVYAFYNYNGDNVGHGDPEFALPDGRVTYRADTLGWYCYRYSDDNGRTWSQERYRLPMPVAACDRANQWAGRVQVFWGIDKPKIADGVTSFAFTRLGRYMLDNGEGWLYRSENVLTQRDVGKIKWEILPEGDHGIRKEEFGSIQEEYNMVPLEGNTLYCVYRTTMGYPCHCYSFDGGQTWTTPEPMTYKPEGRIIRNSRACPQLWKTTNGRFLFWHHNNGRTGFGKEVSFVSRNVAWLSAGKIIDGKMHWSQPEIVRYCPNPLEGCSYPDLLEDNRRYFLSSTQKSEARIGEIPADFLETLFKQNELTQVAQKNLVLEVKSEVIDKAKNTFVKASLPKLPNLAAGGGFTIEAWVKLPHFHSPRTLIHSVDDQGKGVVLTSTLDGTIRLDFGDGKSAFNWECDPGLLKRNKIQHVAFIIDGGPKVVSVVVDGVLCDGGTSTSRRYGWGHFLMSRHLRSNMPIKAHEIEHITHGGTMYINRNHVRTVRVYDRYLLTSEAVGNYHAGFSQKQ